MFNKDNKIITFGTLLVFFFPLIINAQSTDAEGVLDKILETLEGVVPVIIGLAVILFLWGMLKFIMASDEAGRKEGKNFMLWGIVSLFVMVSVWGLVAILVTSFPVANFSPATTTQQINIPE